MGRTARDSLIINNFFTLASIVIISIVLTLYVNYFSVDDKKNTIEKLPCEKQSQTYIKIYNEKLLKKSINAIEKGFYKLEGSFLKPIHMKSKIEQIVYLKELDEYYISLLEIKPKDDIQKYLKIKYEIIEDDKKDPNKKGDNLNAGSVITTFKINSTEIFRINSQFQFMYANAIKDRIDCSIKVYKNYVKNYKQ